MADFRWDESGFEDLYDALEQFDEKTKAKTMKGAISTSLNPAVKAAKEAAPKSDPEKIRGHYTYLHNFVAPGFLSRSIKKYSFAKGSIAYSVVGVTHEAFYGLRFLEGQAAGYKYAKPWFVKQFSSRETSTKERYKKFLQRRIDKALR